MIRGDRPIARNALGVLGSEVDALADAGDGDACSRPFPVWDGWPSRSINSTTTFCAMRGPAPIGCVPVHSVVLTDAERIGWRRSASTCCNRFSRMGGSAHSETSSGSVIALASFRAVSMPLMRLSDQRQDLHCRRCGCGHSPYPGEGDWLPPPDHVRTGVTCLDGHSTRPATAAPPRRSRSRHGRGSGHLSPSRTGSARRTDRATPVNSAPERERRRHP